MPCVKKHVNQNNSRNKPVEQRRRISFCRSSVHSWAIENPHVFDKRLFFIYNINFDNYMGIAALEVAF